jgi:uncharacterized membrane protein YraQ (UPF0718 family)
MAFMKPRKRKTGDLYFLGGVVALYALLLAVSTDGALQALKESGMILLKLLPILAVVVLLLGVLAYYFNAKKLSKHLGRESGWRAWFYAASGGILSHGPSYVWYPLLHDLRDHGTRDGLLITFLYVRAIKIPWLPVMIDYFGWSFTLWLSIFLITFGILQGWLAEWITSSCQRHIRTKI